MPVSVSTWGADHRTTTIWCSGGAIIPSPCDQLFFSRQMSGVYTKQCGEAELGSGVTITIPAGKFASTVSQAEADAAAQAHMDEEGQRQANELGACYPDGKNKFFTNLINSTNWDWVAERGRYFPHYTSFITGIEFNSNWLGLPLMAVAMYDGAVEFEGQIAASDNAIRPDSVLAYTFHEEHGFMHIDLGNYATDYDNLVVERAETLAAKFGETVVSAAGPLYYNQTSYYSFLVADFNSAEAASCRMGNGIFEFVTSRRKVEPNGKVSGSYFATFKDRLYIWRYSNLTQDYEIVAFDTYDHRGKTAYFQGVVHLEQSGAMRAFVYVNGVKLLAITDKNMLYVKPCPYMRGQVAMDYWFGDVFSGGINNCDPLEALPTLRVEYRQPTELTTFPGVLDEEEGLWYIPPTEIIGATTAEEANAPPYSLAPGSVGRGFAGYWPNFNDQITQQGSQSFAQAHLWAKFDFTGSGGLPNELLGCTALFVYQFRSMAKLADDVLGMNRQFLVPVVNSHICNVQLPDNPYMGELYEGSIWDLYYANGTDLIRDPCWDGLSEEYGDYHPITPTYRWACDSIDLVTKPNGGLVSKQELAQYYFKPSAGWYDIRQLEDAYSEIRGFCLKTGIEGIRTTEPLEAPVYPAPPACKPPISCSTVNLLMTLPVVATTQDNGLIANTAQLCDSMFSGLYSVPRGGWDWSVKVEDIYETENIGTEEDPVLRYGQRYLKVTLRTSPEELMDDGLTSSSQLTALNLQRMLFRVYVGNDTAPVDTTGLIYDWPLPIYEVELPQSHATFNVPPTSPGGGSGAVPPEVIQVFNFPIPNIGVGTEEPPEALVLVAGRSYRFEIYRPNNPDIPNQLEDYQVSV